MKEFPLLAGGALRAAKLAHRASASALSEVRSGGLTPRLHFEVLGYYMKDTAASRRYSWSGASRSTM